MLSTQHLSEISFMNHWDTLSFQCSLFHVIFLNTSYIFLNDFLIHTQMLKRVSNPRTVMGDVKALYTHMWGCDGGHVSNSKRSLGGIWKSWGKHGKICFPNCRAVRPYEKTENIVVVERARLTFGFWPSLLRQHGRRQFEVTYDIGVYMPGGTEILNGYLESTLISMVAHGDGLFSLLDIRKITVLSTEQFI